MEFSVQDVFLELPSSGTLIGKKLESQKISKSLGTRQLLGAVNFKIYFFSDLKSFLTQ